MIEAKRLKYLKSRPAPCIPPVPPKREKLELGNETGFRPREATQEVRNCSKQPRELQSDVVSRVFSCLLEMGCCTEQEWNRGGKLMRIH